jgi:hypothetical protein
LSSPAERLRIGTIGLDVVAANRGGVARIVALLEPLLAERARHAGAVRTGS